jgi:hypothetical protein
MSDIEKTLDNFLGNENPEKEDNNQEEFLEVKEKDGLIERVNKKIITEDGRLLLQD